MALILSSVREGVKTSGDRRVFFFWPDSVIRVSDQKCLFISLSLVLMADVLVFGILPSSIARVSQRRCNAFNPKCVVKNKYETIEEKDRDKKKLNSTVGRLSKQLVAEKNEKRNFPRAPRDASFYFCSQSIGQCKGSLQPNRDRVTLQRSTYCKK